MASDRACKIVDIILLTIYTIVNSVTVRRTENMYFNLRLKNVTNFQDQNIVDRGSRDVRGVATSSLYGS